MNREMYGGTSPVIPLYRENPPISLSCTRVITTVLVLALFYFQYYLKFHAIKLAAIPKSESESRIEIVN